MNRAIKHAVSNVSPFQRKSLQRVIQGKTNRIYGYAQGTLEADFTCSCRCQRRLSSGSLHSQWDFLYSDPGIR